jgi:hypothetical protein
MESRNYKELVEQLKAARPEIGDSEALADRVLAQIRKEQSEMKIPEMIQAYVFGWVDVGWVRRTLVTAATLLVAVFVWQQAVILQRIDKLTAQREENRMYLSTGLPGKESGKLMNYGISAKDLKGKYRHYSEQDIDEMVKSFSKLQNRYSDLLYMIDNDPELRKMVEQKLSELNTQTDQ